MTREISLTDLIREKNLTEPQVVISNDERGLYLVSLTALINAMDALDAGEPAPHTNVTAIDRGWNLVNTVMCKAKPGDAVLFSLENDINVSFLRLREDIEATVRRALKRAFTTECDHENVSGEGAPNGVH